LSALASTLLVRLCFFSSLSVPLAFSFSPLSLPAPERSSSQRPQQRFFSSFDLLFLLSSSSSFSQLRQLRCVSLSHLPPVPYSPSPLVSQATSLLHSLLPPSLHRPHHFGWSDSPFLFLTMLFRTALLSLLTLTSFSTSLANPQDRFTLARRNSPNLHPRSTHLATAPSASKSKAPSKVEGGGEGVGAKPLSSTTVPVNEVKKIAETAVAPPPAPAAASGGVGGGPAGGGGGGGGEGKPVTVVANPATPAPPPAGGNGTSPSNPNLTVLQLAFVLEVRPLFLRFFPFLPCEETDDDGIGTPRTEPRRRVLY
jgi:hypothetical protein